MKATLRWLLGLSFVLAVTGPAKAGTILGNLPPANVSGGALTGGGTNYAVEFQATSDETVDTVKTLFTIGLGNNATVGIYNATSSNAIGSQIGGNFTATPSLGVGAAVPETFGGSAALANGNKYFLVVDGLFTFLWSASNPSLTPTGAGATYLAAGAGALNSFVAANVVPSFELDGTISNPNQNPNPNPNPNPGPTADTPEPATLTMLGIGLVGFAGWGWRKRKAAV
jgi:hypothetical protein